MASILSGSVGLPWSQVMFKRQRLKKQKNSDKPRQSMHVSKVLDVAAGCGYQHPQGVTWQMEMDVEMGIFYFQKWKIFKLCHFPINKCGNTRGSYGEC